MSYTSVPLLSTGDWIDAAWGNTYWRDNMAALWPYTTAGDLAYGVSASGALARLANVSGGVLYGAASAPAWLAKPSVDSVLKNTSAGTPSWLAIGDLTNDFASVYHNTTQTCTTGVAKIVDFNSEYSDLKGWHDNSTNPSRITVSATGYYQGSCFIEYTAAGGSGTYWDTLQMLVNGSSIGEDRRLANVDAFSKMFCTTFPIVAMTAGQYAQVSIEQNSGGTRTIIANVKFSLLRVG